MPSKQTLGNLLLGDVSSYSDITKSYFPTPLYGAREMMSQCIEVFIDQPPQVWAVQLLSITYKIS